MCICIRIIPYSINNSIVYRVSTMIICIATYIIYIRCVQLYGRNSHHLENSVIKEVMVMKQLDFNLIPTLYSRVFSDITLIEVLFLITNVLLLEDFLD